MYSRKSIVIAALMSTVCGAAYAQNPGPSNNAAGEIAAINEEIAVLSAKLKRLEVQAQIANKQAEMKAAGAKPEEDISRTSHRSGVTPVVKSIEGMDGKLRATLALGQGVTQTAETGEVIADGWTVARITVNAVTLVRGAERVNLGFGAEPARQQADAGALRQSGFAPFGN